MNSVIGGGNPLKKRKQSVDVLATNLASADLGVIADIIKTAVGEAMKSYTKTLDETLDEKLENHLGTIVSQQNIMEKDMETLKWSQDNMEFRALLLYRGSRTS